MSRDGLKDSALTPRVAVLLEALLRHFDVLAGEARDTQAARARLLESRDPAAAAALLDEVESDLLAADSRLAMERDREEKALGYLQRQCEEMNVTARMVQEALEQGRVSIDALGTELQPQLLQDEPSTRRIAHQVDTLTHAGGELARLADRLMVLERKINELRSGVRNRNDLAFKDDWTGLYREDGFQLRATELFARWERAGAPLSAVLVSLDVRGDQPLTPLARNELMAEAAADLERRVRVSDVLALTAPDRFTLLLPDTNLEGCHAFASRMVAALENAGFEPLGAALRIEVVAGITSAVAGDSLDSMLGRAAQAHEQALAKGVCCEALI